jgi:hypothetical protein
VRIYWILVGIQVANVIDHGVPTDYTDHARWHVLVAIVAGLWFAYSARIAEREAEATSHV